MENFAQLLFYGQIQKKAAEFAVSAKTTATLPRARYNEPARKGRGADPAKKDSRAD